MKANPFRSRKRNPFVADAVDSGIPEMEAKRKHAEPCAAKDGIPQCERAKRFANRACLISGIFLTAAAFVFREIQHTRELYRMSRLVARAEAERRQWQEKQRLEEGRAANLVAIIYSQQVVPHQPDIVRAAYCVTTPLR